MKRSIRIRAFLITGLLFSCLSCTSPVHHDLVISHVNIVDVKTGEILEDRHVAIDGKMITAIYEEEKKYSDSTEIIDGSGKYLIPGLWDMHTHNNHDSMETIGSVLIPHGITGIREMFGSPLKWKEVKGEIHSGSLNSPDLYNSGLIIDHTPAQVWGAAKITSPDEAKAVALQQINQGAEFLKIYNNLTKDEFLAVADVSEQYGVPFAGHIPLSVSLDEAIEAGMTTSEHLYGMMAESSSASDSIRNLKLKRTPTRDLWAHTFSIEKCREAASKLAESDLWICPTMGVIHSMAYPKLPQYQDENKMKYIPGLIRSDWEGWVENLEKSPERVERYQKQYETSLDILRILIEEGVNIIAGSDYPNPYTYPGLALHEELSFFVKAGMTELEALRTATLNPAIFMKKEDSIGSVAPGKLASLVLLKENPLDDIRNTNSIEMVLLRGQYFSRPNLDHMLANAEREASKKPLSVLLQKYLPNHNYEITLNQLDSLIINSQKDYALSEEDLDILAYDLLKDNKVKAAQVIYKRIIEIAPYFYPAYDGYAEALILQGEYQKGLEAYKKSLDLNVGNPHAKKMVDSLSNLQALQ